MQLTRLVLPAPFGPMMATSSPSPTCSPTSCSAYTPPKRRETWSIARRAAPPLGRVTGVMWGTLADGTFTIPADAALPARPLRRQSARGRLLRRVLRGPAPHRARPGLVARGAGRLGTRSGPALRRDLESAQMVAANAADVRGPGPGAAADRTLEPPLRRADRACHPRPDAARALAKVRRALRLDRVQPLPRRRRQRGLARRQDLRGDRGADRRPRLPRRAAQVPLAAARRREVALLPPRPRRSSRHRRQDAADLGALGPEGGCSGTPHQPRVPVWNGRARVRAHPRRGP